MSRLLLAVSAALSVSLSLGREPIPDTSEQCLSCEAQVASMEEMWSNETTVAEILAELQSGCKSYPKVKEDVCSKLADIFVQIPPALFEGMNDLDWPIPEAMCATVAKCHVNCCHPDDPPEQVHLSVASSDRTIMGVAWTSLNQTGSVVQYGLRPNRLTFSETGRYVAYTTETKYTYWNWTSGWIGTLHTARMTGLKPATTYYYRVGDGVSKWSEVFEFKTWNPLAESMTFAIIGDMDYAENSDATIASIQRLVEAGKVDAVIHSGDISYADGYEPHFDDYFNKIQPIAARVPYMAAPGNHEFWYNFTSYKNRFYMPGLIDEGGSGDNMYFSWNAGYAHFLSCDSETAIDTANFSPTQIEWMAKDLRRVNRKQHPWVVANFHRPMYCATDNDSTCGRQASLLKKEAERIFYENEVDVVISGHVHSYERTFPVYKEQKMSDVYNGNPYVAPMHVLQGASGNREGNIGSVPPAEERPSWSAAARTEVGFALMVISEHELDWTYYGSCKGQEDVVLDHALLTR